LFNQLEEITASTVLEDDPQVVACLVPVEELKHMPILEVVEDAHLITFNTDSHYLIKNLLSP
jgi:hypothetical protein